MQESGNITFDIACCGLVAPWPTGESALGLAAAAASIGGSRVFAWARVKICGEWREWKWYWRHQQGEGATTREDSMRTHCTVRDDAFRAQIWVTFASPLTTRSKCVGPLGWVFLAPVSLEAKQMTAIRLRRAVEDSLMHVHE
jgi:hypothetical protein